jgi:hypothetical protein
MQENLTLEELGLDDYEVIILDFKVGNTWQFMEKEKKVR